MSKPQRIAFLLGAGTSIPAGLPTTSQMTSRVLSGQDIIHHTDGTYYLEEPDADGMTILDAHVQRVTLLLRRLQLEIERYYLYDFGVLTNYEDLYYLCSQIYDSEVREYENPLVGAFVDRVAVDLHRICNWDVGSRIEPWDTQTLFREACNYTRDVVWRMLLAKYARFDHLSCLVDACQDPDLTRVDVFTLNHDTLLERCFTDAGIGFDDGFGQPVNDVRYWNPSIMHSVDSSIRLLKLHGSIHWFRFPPNLLSVGPEAIGIPLTDDIWHTISPAGQMQAPAGGRPVLLAGTFNKMLDYTTSIFADLHCLFREALRSTSRLIISGYGFGDKGINSQIVEWMYESTERGISLIHPTPTQCRTHSRGVIMKNWDYWLRDGRLRLIQSRIEDAPWAQVKDGA